MNEQDLLDLKKEIEDAKTEVNQLEGKRSGLLEQLKDEWDCKSVDEAKKMLKKLKAEKDDLAEKLEKGLDELEQKYDFE